MSRTSLCPRCGVNFLPDDLERGLAQIPFPEADTPSAPSPSSAAVDELARWWQQSTNAPQSFQLVSPHELHETLAAAAQHVFATQAAGKTLWWFEAAGSGFGGSPLLQ